MELDPALDIEIETEPRTVRTFFFALSQNVSLALIMWAAMSETAWVVWIAGVMLPIALIANAMSVTYHCKAAYFRGCGDAHLAQIRHFTKLARGELH